MTISEPRYETFAGFPMPSDPESLVDRSKRPIVRTASTVPRFPFPVPNGWYIVGEARDGADAIDRIRATEPDIAVLDARMPSLSSFLPTLKPG